MRGKRDVWKEIHMTSFSSCNEEKLEIIKNFHFENEPQLFLYFFFGGGDTQCMHGALKW